jgi:pyruvate dehydrogenase E2 component (dihydrolipoamide acetyltransferase)
VSLRRFNLPDLGEGLPDAEIVRWLVEVGQPVTVNQPLVEVETAKAVVEVPSPFAGVLAERHFGPGDTVAVGAALVSIETGAADTLDGGEAGGGEAGSSEVGGAEAGGATAAGRAAAAEPRTVAGVAHVDPDEAEPGAEERVQVLVGYGPRPGGGRRARRAAAAASAPASPPPPPRQVEPRPAAAGAAGISVLAKPPVRKLARDLGVDLRTVTGTGPHGSISRSDVRAARDRLADAGAATDVASNAASGAAAAGPVAGAGPAAAGPVAAAGPLEMAGAVTRVPVGGVRRAMADAMTASAFTAPHATLFATVDVTATMAARDALAAMPEFADIKITPLLFTARALLAAIRRNPLINSRWEQHPDGSAEIVVSRQVNLGIAVDTPRGLVVPNIPDAGSLTLPELARRLNETITTAREGRLSPAAMRDGTVTITNIGTLGVDVGTPIINPPEAAILALGAVRPTPWVHEGELAVRTVAQLALAIDHRIVDGALGARVLGDISRMLGDPLVGLAWS